MLLTGTPDLLDVVKMLFDRPFTMRSFALSEIDRVLNCLAFYSVIAWRVMYVCHLGRQCPEMDCEVIFEPSEWKSVYTILGLPVPAEGCPSLNDVVRAIATLGGFIDRPKNDPGTQTLWVGLQRCYDLSNAWNAFGPGSTKNSPG